MPWTEDLPEDLRENETLNRFADVEALSRSYIEAKAVGSQSIRIPTKDAGEDVRGEFLNRLINHVPELVIKPDLSEQDQAKEFYRTMGMPEEFAGYENPDEVELEPEVEAELRQVLHSANLTNAQYQKVISQFSSKNKEAADINAGLLQQDSDSLKGKWGQAYEDRIKAAQRVNDEMYPTRNFEKLSSSELEGLYNTSKALTGKPTQVASQPDADSGILSPGEAKSRADEIMNNPAYWDNSSPMEQSRLKKKYMEYMEQAGFGMDINQLRAS